LRDYKLYLHDIKESIEKIRGYTKGYSFTRFAADSRTVDAVIRNLEIIGEAGKNVPKRVKDRYPEIDWKAIVGMRNILAHEYFGVRLQIIWKTVKDRLPELLKAINKILESG
jgi:uncharacterized protein with HEPN domain